MVTIIPVRCVYGGMGGVSHVKQVGERRRVGAAISAAARRAPKRAGFNAACDCDD